MKNPRAIFYKSLFLRFCSYLSDPARMEKGVYISHKNYIICKNKAKQKIRNEKYACYCPMKIQLKIWKKQVLVVAQGGGDINFVSKLIYTLDAVDADPDPVVLGQQPEQPFIPTLGTTPIKEVF